MTVRKAIAEAESILPGRKSPEGRKDPRWQAIIEIGMFIPTEPEAVWNFVERWDTIEMRTFAPLSLRACWNTCWSIIF